MSEWTELWPRIAFSAVKDCDGRPPRYTFFYPEEEYRPEFIAPLAEMAQAGIADVEVHIHHDREGREDFVHRITRFCEVLHNEHGLLRKSAGLIRFGFIHGNWALDNSLPGGQWCGLNDEISLLRQLGCYADFTMPSGASPSQSRMMNRIYWATDNPDLPKSYDQGIEVRPGSQITGDLLMIPGPFGLRRGRALRPRMETGELAAYDPPCPERVRHWFGLAPRIGEHMFIKLYTHGAQEPNMNALLKNDLHHIFDWVKAESERRDAKVHFVSAWQMYGVIRDLCGRSTALPLANNQSAAECNPWFPLNRSAAV